MRATTKPATARPRSSSQGVPVNHPSMLTISRPEMLRDGSDAAFRSLIHRLISYARLVSEIRDGLGALIDLTGVQYEIVMAVQRLQGSTGVPVVDVAAWMRRSGAFVTIEAGKLVRRALLAKTADTSDRRRVLLSLTAEAQRRLRDLAGSQRQVNDVLFASLGAPGFAFLDAELDGLLLGGERAADVLGLLLRDNARAQAAPTRSQTTRLKRG